ncbi:hypothetical protein [Agromyces seonyuensis]|uniref:Nuclear transport factor 2 family protein n=1 Tax=Agromyces seonyuensis TaxID=2662446 RepID=A0A6I4NZ81_9MICO|nr:hypothetical protein [Agromyces seonyuensis]MWB98522.1 hypothetical protein [Agromyces seonyuensis]
MGVRSDEVRAFLVRYAATLTKQDAEAAAELWSTPGLIADDRFSGVLGSREEMAEGLRQSYPLYRQLGLAAVEYELRDEKELSDHLVLVGVRWLFLDDEGQLLTDSSSYYLLRDESDGLRACVCVETDAAEKLQALAADRGIELPTPPQTGEEPS